MSWLVIAKKDIQDSIRSKGLWALIGSFLLFNLLLSLAVSPGSVSGPEAVLGAIGLTYVFGILLFVPLAGLFISLKSIVRERESGSINLLLSLPHSRRDMLLGKFAGRAVVMTVAILATFLPGTLYLLSQIGFETDVLYAMFSLLFAVVLFGLMFVAIGVGFSGLVKTETQATVGGICLFFLLYFWIFIIGAFGIDLPVFLQRFWLFAIFIDIMLTLVGLYQGSIGDPSFLVYADELFSLDFDSESLESVSIILQDWFVFVILAFWIVVPLAIGYVRFNSTDI